MQVDFNARHNLYIICQSNQFGVTMATNRVRGTPVARPLPESNVIELNLMKALKKTEETLPVGGPLPEIKHRIGRPSKAGQLSREDWYGSNYKPQRAPDGSKIGTPRTGAKYEDMETSLAVLAWSLDNPDKPMPRWLYDAQTQWYIEQYKKTHKY
jgi:hypothetical protein